MMLSRSLLCVPRVLRGESPDLELRPNPGPELLPPAPSWEIIGSLGLIGLVLLLAATVLWLWVRRPRVVSPLPPGEWALRELGRLEGNGEDLEQRYARVADVLRHFLAARFHLDAPLRTTPEFLRLLSAAERLSQEQKAGVAETLAQADLVKFARATPTADDTDQFLNRVRSLVQQLGSLE